MRTAQAASNLLWALAEVGVLEAGPSLARAVGDPIARDAAAIGAFTSQVWLPGKENSNSHGARPVHLIITMLQWIRTSGLSIKNSLSVGPKK